MVLLPDAIIAPEGKVQLYPVAPITVPTLYIIPVAFAQTLVEPLMIPADAAPVPILTVNELAVPFPQLEVGVTLTTPPEVP